ncbi:glycosyltransferase family 39 protein [Variovorax sp. J2P1-59]|uniref:glycosyltransferase family 39 protein n=1 Tax=Variovorax flavidus TaxID=3053501 RepID=UPI002577B7CA|nr:glycosyltransferase family 39 protein [Variovorax sp. J2P1-59]MDM0073432.1 glycosyltransferase family 39 protein [Variovorax sp. J2P1-59]
MLTQAPSSTPRQARPLAVRNAAPAAAHRESRGASAERPLPAGLLAFLLVMLAAVWFGSLSTRSLISPDEGRYASLAWEMLRSGDWVTPRLNGLLYFEKPPLQYWISALFLHLFGLNVFAARLWPALAGFLTVLSVGGAAWRLWGKEAGIRSLAVAASMTWVFGNAHFLTLDASLTLFLTVALCAVLIAEHADATVVERRNWIWLAWAAMAGAVLSKGLVGILIPGATLVLTCASRRDFGLWRRMHWVSGVLIFLVLAAPWFVLVSMRNPAFAQFFFIHEHFARYLSNVHQREGAWWYYLPLLLGGMFPWTSALPWLWTRRTASGPSQAIAPQDILIVYAAFVLLFFSASGSKLPSYILPVFPALALLVGLRLRDASPRVLRRHLLFPVAVWAIVLVASTQTSRIASHSTPAEVFAQLGGGARWGAVTFLSFAAFAGWLLRRRGATLAIATLALGHVLSMAVVMAAHNPFGQLKSAAPFVSALEPVLQAGAPLFAVRAYDQTLPFYLRRDVTLVDYQDEFAMGQALEPTRSIASFDEFVARWKALPQAAAYMDFPSYGELHERGIPMRVIYQDSRRVVVSKQ